MANKKNTQKGIDCLKDFLCLFKGDNTKEKSKYLIEHMVKSSYFIHPDKVIKRNDELEKMLSGKCLCEIRCPVFDKDGVKSSPNRRKEIALYSKADKLARNRIKDGLLPARWTSSDLYICDNSVFVHAESKKVRSKSLAIEYQKERTLYFKVNENKYIPINIDGDGNDNVSKTIEKATGHVVGKGEKSTIKNAIISHIWSEAKNPFYFTGLWNVVIVPTFCNFILDIDDNKLSQDYEYRDVVLSVKGVFKALCYKLYDIGNIQYIKDAGVEIELPKEEYFILAQTYENLVNYLPNE